GSAIGAGSGGIVLGAEASRRPGWSERLIGLMGFDRLVAIGVPALLFWLATSFATFAALALALARSHRERRRWPTAEVFGTRVRVSPADGPAVVGTLRPEIVVPGWLLSRPENEVRLALVHEREHLRAGDRWLLLFGSLVIAMMPWNPAVWW